MGYREVLGGKDGIGGPNQANLKMEFCNKTVYRTVTVEENSKWKVDQRWNEMWWTYSLVPLHCSYEIIGVFQEKLRVQFQE